MAFQAFNQKQLASIKAEKNAFVNNLFIVTYGFRDKKYLMEVTNPIEFFDDVPSIEKYFKL